MTEIVARLPCIKHGRYSSHRLEQYQVGVLAWTKAKGEIWCPGGEEITLTRQEDAELWEAFDVVDTPIVRWVSEWQPTTSHKLSSDRP